MKAYKRNGILKILKALICGLVVGCAPDEICFSENTSLVEVNFVEELYAGTDSAEVVNDTLIFYSVKALGTDSIFVEQDTLTFLSLPVNTADTITWYLFDSERGMDSLELRYRRMQRFISEDCGPEQIFDELKPGTSSFDSVVVTNTLLNAQISNNVEVFY